MGGDFVGATFEGTTIIGVAPLAIRGRAYSVIALPEGQSHRFKAAVLRHRQPADGEYYAQQLEETFHYSGLTHAGIDRAVKLVPICGGLTSGNRAAIRICTSL